MPVNHESSPLRALHHRLSRWLLPPRCLLCGEAADTLDLCRACIGALPKNDSRCSRCALPLPAPAPDCGACLREPPPFSSAVAPWIYQDALAELVPRFKFHRDLACGRVLAELALQALRDWPGWHGVQQMVPMPLHRDRLARRGYNQALELARPLAHAHRLSLRPDLLQRCRATAAQTELDAAARRRNLRGAFDAAALDGATVLLVDDVITTGATVREAAKTLLRAGAAEVRVLALARAP
ncbi:MAG: ComF family protein [Lysobacteraceae bacterium]